MLAYVIVENVVNVDFSICKFCSVLFFFFLFAVHHFVLISDANGTYCIAK